MAVNTPPAMPVMTITGVTSTSEARLVARRISGRPPPGMPGGKPLRLATMAVVTISTTPMMMPGMMPARNSRATETLAIEP